MPGLGLITELKLFKERLENIVCDIEYYNQRIVLRQILFHSKEFVQYHIEYIEDFLREIEDLENLTNNIVCDIEYYNQRIVLRQILFHSKEFVQYHIEYIEDFLREIEDLENLTNIQKERAKTLLKPFQGLIKIEQMLNQVRENSAGDSASNLVSEPVIQS